MALVVVVDPPLGEVDVVGAGWVDDVVALDDLEGDEEQAASASPTKISSPQSAERLWAPVTRSVWRSAGLARGF
jgi:hypothetical protein